MHVIRRSGARQELVIAMRNARFKCEKQASWYLVPGIVVAERMLDSPHEQGVTLSVSNTNGGTLIDKLCVQWHA